jgi:TonB-dependent SusC/RagA subfamily outer membrane receptor
MQSPVRIPLAGFALLGTLATTGCHLNAGNTPSPEAAARAGQRGATGVLDEGDLDRRRVTRFEELLEARVSGVRVRRLANGEFIVQVRGINAIHGTTQPLFVLDGVPLPDSRSLTGINPADVARIEVLKDASAAAYGARGANGVILITTHRP